MVRKKILFLTAALLVLMVTGCSQPAEGQTDTAIQKAREAFETNRQKPTEEADGIDFFKPVGWKAEIKKEERTILLSKGHQMITVQFDPNAKEDSQAFYELFTADPSKEIIQQQTFSNSGNFGFVVVSEHSESTAEVITGTGTAQAKAIVEKSKLETMVGKMMQITRSVHIESE